MLLPVPCMTRSTADVRCQSGMASSLRLVPSYLLLFPTRVTVPASYCRDSVFKEGADEDFKSWDFNS
jgi:hypothetical protein